MKKDELSQLLAKSLETQLEAFIRNRFAKFALAEERLSIEQTVKLLKRTRDFLRERAGRTQDLIDIAKILRAVVFLHKKGVKIDDIRLFALYFTANRDYLLGLDLETLISP